MGQALGKQEDIFQKLQNYKAIETIRDSNYGDVQLMLDQQQNKQVAVKELLIQSQEEFEIEVQQLKQKKEQKHKNCLEIIDYLVQTEDRFCSSINRLIWLIEYVPRDLSVVIRGKRLQSVQFTENQIISILQQTMEGLIFFYSNQITHGNIRSNSIFVTYEKEQNLDIKIADPLIIKQQSQFVYCMTQNPKRGMYLSPQLLKALFKKNWQPTYDEAKSDIFSLGVVALELSNLQYCDNIYDFSKGVIDLEVLENHLNVFKQKYSEKLSNIVKQMLQIEESTRLNLEQLKELLQQKQNENNKEQQILIELNNNKQKTEDISQSNLKAQIQKKQQENEKQNKADETNCYLQNNENQKFQQKNQKKHGISLLTNNENDEFKIKKQEKNIKNINQPLNAYHTKDVEANTNKNYQNQVINQLQQSPIIVKNKEIVQALTPHEQIKQNMNLINEYSIISNKCDISPIVTQDKNDNQNNTYFFNNNIKEDNNINIYANTELSNNTLNFTNYQILGEQDCNYRNDNGSSHSKQNNQQVSLKNKIQASEQKYQDFSSDYKIPANIQNIIDEFKEVKSRNFNQQLQIENSEENYKNVPQIQQQYKQQLQQQLPNIENCQQNDQYLMQENMQQDQFLQQQQLLQQNNQQMYQNPAAFYQYIEDIDIDMKNFAKMEDSNQMNLLEKIQETYEDGSIYDGEKLNGRRHGHGKFYYADGGYYEGEWKDGRMDGLGTLYYPSGGLAYLGQWKDDKFNGKGTVYNEIPQYFDDTFDFANFDNLGEFWQKYEGDFMDDNKDGIGSLYLSNGDKFTGYFSNDLVHGQGTYFKTAGEVINGCWNQNRLEYTFHI